MPLLALPKHADPEFGTPNRKPLGPVEIDWNNPITRGLVGCYILQDGQIINVLNRGGEVTNNGLVKQISPSGFSLKGNGSDAWAQVETQLDPNLDFSCVMGFEDMGTTGNQFLCSNGSINSGAHYWGMVVNPSNLDGVFGIEFRVGAVNLLARTIDAGADTGFHTGGMTRVGPTSAVLGYAYLDGRNKATEGPESATMQSTSEGSIGSRRRGSSANDDFLSGNVLFRWTWQRALSDAEHMSIANDAYQVLRPAVDPSYFFSGVAPAPFNFPLFERQISYRKSGRFV